MQKTLTELREIPISSLFNIKDIVATKLHKIGLYTAADCLLHLPIRYLDKTAITKIKSATVNEYFVFKLKIAAIKTYTGRKPSLLCRTFDDTGTINLRFYNFLEWHKKNLRPNAVIICWGEFRMGKNAAEIYHPEYKLITTNNDELLTKHLTPVYPTTKGITQKFLSLIIDKALALLCNNSNIAVPKYLPAFFYKIDLKNALLTLHKPEKTDLEAILNRSHWAIKKLAFEELLAQAITTEHLKQEKYSFASFMMTIPTDYSLKLTKAVNFKLTNAQQRVIKEITTDLSNNNPMMRLLQGDVGSGKTIVAAHACLICIENNYQVAFMAPTELLAKQVYSHFVKWSNTVNFKPVLLISKLSTKQYNQAIEDITTGAVNLIVGTHAIFQKQVVFQQLGLIIIDEQHRFGVNQRLALQHKTKAGYMPHQLVMSATPIPRTLAMSLYTGLDISILDELPPKRTPIQTAIINANKREQVIARIYDNCRQGSQAYWVCTLIEESETIECQAAENTLIDLQAQLPEINIGLVHGKMHSKQKQQVMEQFLNNEIQLLIATTVIEVGIDVPNANLMIIENPERLGLSQLHQLRGRVGRGDKLSYCILLYQPPLSWQTKQRLQILRHTTDGFKIAEQDMQIRGVGEFLGTKQTGAITYKIANLDKDMALMTQALDIATKLVIDNLEFTQVIVARWLADNVNKYAKV